jgi:hypothetical protein
MLREAASTHLTAVSPLDRRSEERYETDGEVRFWFDDPVRHEVTGRLLDYSRSGFRAQHDYASLSSGQVVSFQHLLARGRAKVMWNRIADGNVECGFLVL